jgi:hypothetical protein
MKLFTTIYDDARLLGPFLRHYRALGVSDFLIAVSTQCATAVDEFAASYNITVFKGLDVKSHMLGGAAAVSEMRRMHQTPNEWVALVDLDEFLEPLHGLSSLIDVAESEGANVIRGIMYDRFTDDGRLAEVLPDSNPATIFPIRARFIRDVMNGVDHKGVLIKGGLRPAIAHHHFHDEVVASVTVEIAHYKWCVGAIDRLRMRYCELMERGINFAGEYKKILDHYDRHGRFVWKEFGGELVGNRSAPPASGA